MKRTLGLLSVAALAAGMFAAPASAQLVNFPVVVSPHGAQQRAFGIAGLYGKGLNDDSGKLTSIGGAAGIALGGFAIRAGVVSVKNGSSEISFGGNVEFAFVKGGPLALSAFAGYGKLNNVLKMNVPFGVGIGFSPAMSGGGAFEIWAAPSGRLQQLDEALLPGSSSAFGFGVSGGARYTLAMGLGLGVSIDYQSIDLADVGSSTTSTLFGAGVFYSFSMGGGDGGM